MPPPGPLFDGALDCWEPSVEVRTDECGVRLGCKVHLPRRESLPKLVGHGLLCLAVEVLPFARNLVLGDPEALLRPGLSLVDRPFSTASSHEFLPFLCP